MTDEQVVQPEDVEHPPPPRRDLLAAQAANLGATVWFLLANVVIWAIWLTTGGLGLDPSPFQLLTLGLSFEAIVLTIAVLIQNRLDAQMRDRQAEADVKNNAIAAEATLETKAMLETILGRLDARAG